MRGLVDADWLEAVTSSQHDHLSPNHDLCCRLLSHIPLLAAYTGWPATTTAIEDQLNNSNNSQAGTRTAEHSNNARDTDKNVEDSLMGWRPGKDDKKYIEEAVRSQLVDSEDLCRLLMVAMATELDRLQGCRCCWGQDGQDAQTSDVTSSVTSSRVVETERGAADDDGHGDTTHDAADEKPKTCWEQDGHGDQAHDVSAARRPLVQFSSEQQQLVMGDCGHGENVSSTQQQHCNATRHDELSNCQQRNQPLDHINSIQTSPKMPQPGENYVELCKLAQFTRVHQLNAAAAAAAADDDDDDDNDDNNNDDKADFMLEFEDPRSDSDSDTVNAVSTALPPPSATSFLISQTTRDAPALPDTHVEQLPTTTNTTSGSGNGSRNWGGVDWQNNERHSGRAVQHHSTMSTMKHVQRKLISPTRNSSEQYDVNRTYPPSPPVDACSDMSSHRLLVTAKSESVSTVNSAAATQASNVVLAQLPPGKTPLPQFPASHVTMLGLGHNRVEPQQVHRTYCNDTISTRTKRHRFGGLVDEPGDESKPSAADTLSCGHDPAVESAGKDGMTQSCIVHHPAVKTESKNNVINQSSVETMGNWPRAALAAAAVVDVLQSTATDKPATTAQSPNDDDDDDCRVTFRPAPLAARQRHSTQQPTARQTTLKRSRLPTPIYPHTAAAAGLQSNGGTSVNPPRRQMNLEPRSSSSSLSSTQYLAARQPVAGGRDRRPPFPPRSTTSHDLKCAVRRKTVIV